MIVENINVHVALHPSIRVPSYFWAVHLAPHPSICLASYVRADHLALHPSIRLASYFCHFHPCIGMASNILLYMNSHWIHLGDYSHVLNDG